MDLDPEISKDLDPEISKDLAPEISEDLNAAFKWAMDAAVSKDPDAEIVEWYYGLTDSDRQTLLEKLLKLDKEHRLDYESPMVKTIQASIEEIMNTMVQYVRDHLDEKYYGVTIDLEKSGSFYKCTKMNKPDEFDFGLLIRWSKYSSITCGELLVLDGQSRQDFSELIKNIHRLCDEGMKGVLPAETLPGWSHGGFKSPEYSGYRRNGQVSMMFQFVYTGSDHTKLCITTDVVALVPTFMTKITSVKDYYEQNFFIVVCDERVTDKIWMVTSTTEEPALGETLTCAENKWMQRFDANSPLKIIMRILKFLNSFGPEPKLNSHFEESEEEDCSHLFQLINRRNKTDDKEILAYFQKVETTILQRFDAKSCKLSNIGEIYPPLQHLCSYTLQELVILLFQLCHAAYGEDMDLSGVWEMKHIPIVLATALDFMYGCNRINECHHNRYQLHITFPGSLRFFMYNSTTPLTGKPSLLSESTLNHVQIIIRYFKQLIGISSKSTHSTDSSVSHGFTSNFKADPNFVTYECRLFQHFNVPQHKKPLGHPPKFPCEALTMLSQSNMVNRAENVF